MVAAQSEPDTIEVHYRPWLKGEEDRFSVGRCVVGSKKTKVVMAEEGDTLEEDVDAEHTSALCIGTTRILLPHFQHPSALTANYSSLFLMSAFGVKGTLQLRLSYLSVPLANDTALRLARLGIELEERFGGPRDIEFAIAKVSLGPSDILHFFLQLQQNRNTQPNDHSLPHTNPTVYSRERSTSSNPDR